MDDGGRRAISLPAVPAGSAPVRPAPLTRLWVLMLAVFAIHNAEELIADLPAWSRTESLLPRVGGLSDSRADFALAVGVLTVAMVVVGAVAVSTRASWSAGVLGWFAIVLLVNAASHVTFSLISRSYMPGLASAILLVTPLSGYVVWRRLRLNADRAAH